MPKIKWTDVLPSVIRMIGPYQWHRDNGYVCDVAAEDVPGIITCAGFELAEDGDLTVVNGIGQKWADELVLAGIVSLRQLVDADTADLAGKIGARWALVQAWQSQAQALSREREQASLNVDSASTDERPRG